jgi:hypothetical protein
MEAENKKLYVAWRLTAEVSRHNECSVRNHHKNRMLAHRLITGAMPYLAIVV